MAHYIAMSGIHGCIPQYCASYDRRKDANDSLKDLHELSNRQYRDLRKYGSIELEPDQGAEYAEVTECSCGNPEQHNDV